VGFTINLDNHNESGSHWVSMFLDLDDKIIFYFDSAITPLRAIKRSLVEKSAAKSYAIRQRPRA
jgi:hypothetical protein